MTLRVELVGNGEQRLWREHHGHGVEYNEIDGVDGDYEGNSLTVNPISGDEVEITCRPALRAGARIELTLGTDE